jgi:hypothetical protein
MVALSCTRYPKPAPYTAAEVDHALAGLKGLRARCYAGSDAARAGRAAQFDFSMQISESGQVQAIPTFASPEEPALIECLRHGLNEVRFPARARDRLDLHLELGAPTRTRANGAAGLASPSPL